VCEIKSPTEAMVCDPAQPLARQLLLEQLGTDVSFETVTRAGTRVTCLNPSRADEFRRTLERAVAEANP
jgi:hypothetical protein